MAEASYVICENCGATYSSEEKVCPYCGAENLPVSVREQTEYVEDLRRRTAELDTVIPSENTRKVRRKINRIGIAAGIIFVLLIFVACVYGIVRTVNRRDFQKESLDILEGYYQQNDYASMLDYLDSHDRTYSSTYGKYNALTEVYRYYSIACEYYDQDLVWINRDGFDIEKFGDVFQFELSYLFRSLYLLKDLEDNDYVYNEQDGAEYLKDLVTARLRDQYLLTDEEIREGTEMYEDFDTDYSDLSKTVLRRLRDAL